MKNFRSYAFFVTALFIVACGGSDNGKRHQPVSNVAKKNDYRFASPKPSEQFRSNDVVSISIVAETGVPGWDSAVVYLDDELIGLLQPSNAQTSWSSVGATVGIHILKATVYARGKTEMLRQNVVLLSDITPEEYTYRIVHTFPHDPAAFTQGLLYSNGIFYEGTGQKGFSEIRKVTVNNGEVVQRQKINGNLFGEGIALFNHHIYQLTWQAGKGMIYDEKTFEQVADFYYEGEGWGLTNDSANMIMSNGTHRLRFMSPEDFHLIREIQAYDNNGAIGYLNELEWVEGKIYANVWQRDLILIIDPASGKVTGKVNMSGLKPAGSQRADVLNGIAYDAEKKRLFVTGKYWPNVFEIELVKKAAISS